METSNSYRALLRIPGLPRVFLGALMGRIGSQMTTVAIVLFALDRFHSVGAAGLAVSMSVLPGLAAAPLAGALLDRYGRVPLIVADFVVAALMLVLVVALNAAGILDVAALIAVVAVGSLTNPLSNAGTRTLLPVLTPARLWDRANACDSLTFVTAVVIGPALAGAVSGFINPAAALLGAAGFFVAGAAVLGGLRTPPPPRMGSGRLITEAWAGVVYLVRHAALRGLALGVSFSNIGYGIAIVAVPVLVLDRLHDGAGVVGAEWACVGIAGTVSGVVAGRMGSEGRERSFMAIGMALMIVSGLLLVWAPDIVAVTIAMAIFGVANGPIDIGLFSMRQRRTDPRWLGRVFSISASFNYIGAPVGSMIAGVVITRSLPVAFFLMACCQVVGIIFILTIPVRSSI